MSQQNVLGSNCRKYTTTKNEILGSEIKRNKRMQVSSRTIVNLRNWLCVMQNVNAKGMYRKQQHRQQHQQQRKQQQRNQKYISAFPRK